jgi:IclR family transcriptional regulator, acetate operon repressor
MLIDESVEDPPDSPAGVLARAFSIMQALPQTSAHHQLAALSRMTGIRRPTVHRLLAQLISVGAVERHDEGYQLSPGLIKLAQGVEPLVGLRRSAGPVMQRVREQTGATVSLVVPTGDRFVALEMIEGHDELPFASQPGFLMPSGTAAAKAIRRARTVGPALGSHRAAIDDQELLEGVTCCAVALRLPGGVEAALQIATAATRPAERFAPIVHRGAHAITVRATDRTGRRS